MKNFFVMFQLQNREWNMEFIVISMKTFPNISMFDRNLENSGKCIGFPCVLYQQYGFTVGARVSCLVVSENLSTCSLLSFEVKKKKLSHFNIYMKVMIVFTLKVLVSTI